MPRNTISIRLTLGNDAAQALRRDVVGSGGFQSLLRRLQRGLSTDNELTLTLEDIERIGRYVNDYGTGGFQGRLDEVLSGLRRLAAALAQLVS